MKTLTISFVGLITGLLLVSSVYGQDGQSFTARNSPQGKHEFQPREAAAQLSDSAAGTAPCNGNVGVRFNLEPRVEAARQQNVAADFILNGVGAGEDLILQTADDWRGNFPSKTWDGSVTGYYVHRAAMADCSVQFEGGLPNFTIQGVTEVGAGTAAVAADPVRDAFFVTDVRFGSTAGIGVFRASASDLLNPANCPDGTHLQKQAESCWMQTLPLLLNPVPQAFYGAELGIAVDERKTGAGTGAGDVYLVASAYVPDPGGGCRFSCSNILFIVACTNSLKCGPMLRLTPGSNNPNVDPVVHVRQDGAITISHGGTLSFHGTPTEAVDFVTCTPVGAPKPPVCGKPINAATISNPLPPLEDSLLLLPATKGIHYYDLPTYPQACQSAGKRWQFQHFPGL